MIQCLQINNVQDESGFDFSSELVARNMSADLHLESRAFYSQSKSMHKSGCCSFFCTPLIIKLFVCVSVSVV